MSFESDLKGIIHREFEAFDIECNVEEMDVSDLTARYCEMLRRHITPIPRTVYLSNEIRTSLGKLARETDPKQQKKVREARNTTFLLRHLLSEGKDVTRFLSKHIKDSPGEKGIPDKLLWDHRMHHFHLCSDVDRKAPAFVQRSDYLLFAIVTQDRVYFVDVRRHHDPEQLLWVRQDLLDIVCSNWPELIKPHVLRGVQGTVVTDEEKRELRRKNVNHAPELGGQAVAPLGWGTTMAGSSTWCRFWADRLLHEIRHHQSCFDAHVSDIRSALEDNGVRVSGELEFELVVLGHLDLADAVMVSLRGDRCLSRTLCNMGFAIVERTTRAPIVLNVVGDGEDG